MLNRGNYRSWVFEEEGAKLSFEKTLFEACERCGWVLHAYAVMGNHYHLALETPEPNLSEGMRWLQSVFATRFNRYRKEAGHVFQGRFKSVVVEDFQRLGWLCHYVNLNPVRAGVCDLPGLRSYRWCGYRLLWDKRKRPAFLSFEACLESAGSLADTATGRAKYSQYLAWLSEDEPRRKAMQFDLMSKGWALGASEFKRALLEDEKSMRACMELGVSDARAMRETAWEGMLDRCLRALSLDRPDCFAAKKSAGWKVAIACRMKETALCRNGWLAERLHMGTEYAVSRYVAEYRRGERREAETPMLELTARVQD